MIMTNNDGINSTSRLLELGGSGYEIVDGEPDIRGWEVKDESGKKIGEVDELIFDSQANKVRYIVLDLEDNMLDMESKNVLVPIGLAELHEEDDDVLLPGVTSAQLRALPEYEKNHIGPDVEASVRNVFGAGALMAGGSGLAGDNDDFYNHGHFNNDNLYQNRKKSGAGNKIPVIEEELQVGKETVQTGGARITGNIVERPVEESINLREEHVTVNRNQVDRPVSEADLAHLREREVELTENAEVPVVSKEARVVEEINISKEVSEREETIRDTVRSTQVDIEDVDSAKRDRGNDP